MRENYTPEELARKLTGEEIWRPVPGLEGSYEVSDWGNVRSLDREYRSWNGVAWCTMRRKGRPKKIDAGQEQYKVGFCKDGKPISWGVAELVLTVFVCPRPEGKEVCHFPDKTRSNNRVENLMWGTSQENQRHKIVHGTTTRGMRVNAGEDNGMAKLTAAKATEIRRLRREGARVEDLADQFGVAVGTVYDIVRGRAWRDA